METVEFLLTNRAWENRCKRTNIVRRDQIVVSATGFRWVNVTSNVVRSLMTDDRLLRKALSAIAPEWWGQETEITITET